LSIEGELPKGVLQVILLFLKEGWPFAVSMLGILAAHEFGHYFVGRLHGVNVTLPYFLPLPFPISPFGTMGAFINMKSVPKNRRQLLDIGLAGPVAGMIVAIPVLLIGLSLSKLSMLPAGPAANGLPQLQMEGNSILYLLAKYTIFGQLLPAPADYHTLSPLLYWVRYFFTSRPLPYGALDVSMHPVAWAGWGGMLITALNLIPAGQLDGGHMIYVLLGRRNSQRLFYFILAAMLLLGLVWKGWWLWAFLIFLLGRIYAEPLDQITKLDNRRKILAIGALILFILVFTPVPLINIP
jgi:membrane-associated protease RseP (regulator of RpoE activity)